LRVALGRNYISKDDFEYLDNEYEGLKIGINNYIQSISKQKDSFE